MQKGFFIDYSMILESYGGDNNEARRAYWRAISRDLSRRIDIKETCLSATNFVSYISK